MTEVRYYQTMKEMEEERDEIIANNNHGVLVKISPYVGRVYTPKTIRCKGITKFCGSCCDCLNIDECFDHKKVIIKE